jgi:hypothetical protein
MKKKIYQKPKIEVVGVTLAQLIAVSQGWSQDQGTAIDVEQEGDYWGIENTDSIGGFDDGFIDID